MAEDAFRGRGEGNRPGPIEIRIPAIPLLTPDSAVAELQREVEIALAAILQKAAGHIKEAAPVGVGGTLGQSFTANPSTRTGGIELAGTTVRDEIYGRVFSSLPYAVIVNDGRNPGPIGRDGIESIGLWVRRKLKLQGEAAERAKWAIATSIRKYGFEGSDFFNTGVAAARPGIEAALASLADNIAEKLTKVAP